MKKKNTETNIANIYKQNLRWCEWHYALVIIRTKKEKKNNKQYIVGRVMRWKQNDSVENQK